MVRSAVGMTQRELADAAGTSQSTVAAYESGAKSPTWRTVERIASSVGLVCYPAVVRPLTRDQRGSLYLHAAVAKKLTNRPTEVIEIAGKTLPRCGRSIRMLGGFWTNGSGFFWGCPSKSSPACSIPANMPETSDKLPPSPGCSLPHNALLFTGRLGVQNEPRGV